MEFRYHNLAIDPYPALDFGLWGLDLILCRNVLIYFRAEDAGRVGERMSRCLGPGGWLIPGPSEPSMSTVNRLQVVTAPGVFVYRTAHATDSIAPPRPLEPTPAPPKPPEPAVTISTEGPSGTTDAPPVSSDPMDDARRALADGEYAEAIAITRHRPYDEDANIIRLRALANHDPPEAEAFSQRLAERAPHSEEIQHLRGVLLLGLGRLDEARDVARRLLYLNPSLVVGHVLLASVLRRGGDASGARRSYRNALKLCLNMPADTEIVFGDGESAGRLFQVISHEIQILNEAQGVPT